MSLLEAKRDATGRKMCCYWTQNVLLLDAFLYIPIDFAWGDRRIFCHYWKRNVSLLEAKCVVTG